MPQSEILVERDGGVAIVRLNRPDRMNAVTVPLLEAMTAAAADLAADETLRAVVLTGEGRAFCAGLDKENFARMAQSGSGSLAGDIMERTHGLGNIFQHASLMWREMPVPVIAAVHGVAVGAGLQIAMGADIRVATPDARLSILEMNWGLVPDMGAMTIWPKLLRSDVLRKLTYTAEMVQGEEALRLGLVTELAGDPLARARELARGIAGRSPTAVRAAKALINAAEREDADEVLLEESRRQASVIGTPHQIEAVMANVQGRAPKFG